MKNHFKDEKSRGNHHTFIDPALVIRKIVSKRIPQVVGVSAGFIIAGERNGGASGKRVKVVDDIRGRGLCVTARQSGSVQQMILFTVELERVKLLLAKEVLKRRIEIHFGCKEENKSRKLLLSECHKERKTYAKDKSKCRSDLFDNQCR